MPTGKSSLLSDTESPNRHDATMRRVSQRLPQVRQSFTFIRVGNCWWSLTPRILWSRGRTTLTFLVPFLSFHNRFDITDFSPEIDNPIFIPVVYSYLNDTFLSRDINFIRYWSRELICLFIKPNCQIIFRYVCPIDGKFYFVPFELVYSLIERPYTYLINSENWWHSLWGIVIDE